MGRLQRTRKENQWRKAKLRAQLARIESLYPTFGPSCRQGAGKRDGAWCDVPAIPRRGGGGSKPQRRDAPIIGPHPQVQVTQLVGFGETAAKFQRFADNPGLLFAIIEGKGEGIEGPMGDVMVLVRWANNGARFNRDQIIALKPAGDGRGWALAGLYGPTGLRVDSAPRDPALPPLKAKRIRRRRA